MAAAGYNVVYKGKWHCTKPADGDDLGARGRRPVRLRPLEPAGRRRQPGHPEAGGGTVDNDGRFMNARSATSAAGDEGALEYLSSAAAQQQPFFLVVSLVNPHDVLFYPKTSRPAGYDDSWLEGDIEPAGDRRRGPLDQADGAGAVPAALQPRPGRSRRAEQKRNYLNFYGNLMKSSDAYLVNVLDTLEDDGPARQHARHPHRRPRRDGPRPRRAAAEELQLLRGVDCGSRSSTRTRSSSRGPRAPTRWSRTSTSCRPWRAWSTRRRGARADWQGVDYSTLVLDPRGASRRRTTSSSPTTTSSPARRAGPTRSRRTTSSASARRAGSWPSTTTSTARCRAQWEMYDLKTRPARADEPRLPGLQAHRPSRSSSTSGCRRKLAQVEKTRLQPLACPATYATGRARPSRGALNF